MDTIDRPPTRLIRPGTLAGALGALLLAAAAHAAPAPLPSFPGAEGFGALATGGRGGTVYHVTTLADAGPGSFREAVSQPHRTVVFDVGGIIKLASNVQLSDNLTLAGETAPGEGICLYGGGVSFGERSNLIIRYLRFREGISGDRGKKSLGGDKASNVIIDHCSVEWGRWDDIGLTVGTHDITVQYCVMAEGIHPQSFGALIDTVTNVTLSHNLWMSNESRNPKAKGTVQYINNVVYNWGETGLCGGHSAADHALDIIANYFIAGPSSNDRFAGQFEKTDHVYQSGNLVDINRDGTLNGTEPKPEEFHRPDEKAPYTLPVFLSAATMHPALPVTTDTAQVAYQKVVASAGCSLHRDAVDLRLIDELRSLGKKGKTLPHTNPAGEALAGGMGEVKGGPAPVDTDHDGIPDAWETAHGLDPKNPADAATVDASGYTALERYLHSLVAGR